MGSRSWRPNRFDIININNQNPPIPQNNQFDDIIQQPIPQHNQFDDIIQQPQQPGYMSSTVSSRAKRLKRGSGGCASKPEPNDEDLKIILDDIIKRWKGQEQILQKIIEDSTCPNGAINLQQMRENMKKYQSGGKRRKNTRRKKRRKKRGGGKGTKRKRTIEPSTPPQSPRPRIINTQIQYPDNPPPGYEWMADPMGNMVLIQTEESFQGGKRHRKTRKKRGGWQRKYNKDNIGAFYYCQNQGNNSMYREKNIITGRWDELRPIDEWKIIEMEDSREYDPILKLLDESNPDFGEFRVEAQQLCNRGYVPLKRNAPKTGAGRKKKTRKKKKRKKTKKKALRRKRKRNKRTRR